MTMKTLHILPAALLLLLPIASQAQPLGNPDSGISAEVRQSLAEARKEVHADLAKARRDLQTENLRLDHGIQIGKHGNGKARTAHDVLPVAEITPKGDFLIDGKAQVVDASQRQQLLAYRGLVLDVAKAGIDIGERAAEAVLKEVDGHWVGVVFSALTGSLERRIERTVKQKIEPGARGICRLLPKVMVSQRRLVSSLPKFQPYASLEQRDIDGCEDEIRSEFASI